MITLRCDGLRKSFGGIRALVDVTLQFSSEKVYSIVGANGSGKTTLFDVLTGFVRPDAGRCFVCNHDTTGLSSHRVALCGVARTFQELRLMRESSILDNVALARHCQIGERPWNALFGRGRQMESLNRERAIHWLSAVGLGLNCDRRARDLSFGEQKLLSLACVLATESVSGVHPALVARIVDVIREACSAGQCVVLIEHDLSFVRRVSDLVVVMDRGSIIAEGRTEDVLVNPVMIEVGLV
jgi:ABC-type branched-subunit amino acid transport system ATPase component